MVSRGLYDRLSGSIDMGVETVQHMQASMFADAISAMLSRRWLSEFGPVVLVGGMAEELQPEFARHFQSVSVAPNPVFANARGMYEVGVRLLANQTATTTQR